MLSGYCAILKRELEIKNEFISFLYCSIFASDPVFLPAWFMGSPDKSS